MNVSQKGQSLPHPSISIFCKNLLYEHRFTIIVRLYIPQLLLTNYYNLCSPSCSVQGLKLKISQLCCKIGIRRIRIVFSQQKRGDQKRINVFFKNISFFWNNESQSFVLLFKHWCYKIESSDIYSFHLLGRSCRIATRNIGLYFHSWRFCKGNEIAELMSFVMGIRSTCLHMNHIYLLVSISLECMSCAWSDSRIWSCTNSHTNSCDQVALFFIDVLKFSWQSAMHPFQWTLHLFLKYLNLLISNTRWFCIKPKNFSDPNKCPWNHKFLPTFCEWVLLRISI